MATQGNFVNDDIIAKDVTADFFFGDGSNLTNLPNPSVVTQACKAFMLANNSINNNTDYTQFNVFPVTGGLSVNVGGFISTSAGIEVPSSGVYIVSANMVYSSTVARANPEYRLTINSVGQPESSCSAYIRNSNGHNESTSSLTTIYTLVAGDSIGLQFRQQASSGTVNLETGSHVMIYRIG